MKKFLTDLFYENDKPSRTGILAFIISIFPLLVWIYVTLYCLFARYNFPHYDAMSIAVFGGSAGGAITIAYNKYINATKNSEDGKPITK